MARKIKITDRKPTFVSGIIENNYKVNRCDFGELSDEANQIASLIKRPGFIAFGGMLAWLIIHLLFIHGKFVYDNHPGAMNYFRQYVGFLLGNNFTYVFPILPILAIFKLFFNKRLNSIRVANEI